MCVRTPRPCGGCHQCCTSPSSNWRLARQQQLRAQQLGPRVHQRHRVLQLVAEAERAAGLVVAAARPQAARDRLVDQPAVGQRVERGVGRAHLHRAQRLRPVRDDAVELGLRDGVAAELQRDALGVAVVLAHAEPEHDGARLALGQVERHLERGARIERRAGAARQPRAAQRHRLEQAAVAADELGAVAGHACRRAGARRRRRRSPCSRRDRRCTGCARWPGRRRRGR